jgi:hypothetical protein
MSQGSFSIQGLSQGIKIGLHNEMEPSEETHRINGSGRAVAVQYEDFLRR